ncbi:MAG: lysophospholipid acyltransferase family protein [Actinomycetota bacterium]
MEYAYHLAKGTVVPPLQLWFNWRFEGLDEIPADGPVLAACNHVSYLDAFAHGYAVVKRGRRPRFLAKSELFDVPVVGRLLNNAKMVPVRRGTGDPAVLRRAEDSLRQGECVLIYPEGTVTRQPDFLPMHGKTGVVRLALATGVPITPIATWGGQHVWQKNGRGSLKFGRPIWVKAGPPIDLSAERDRLDDQSRVRALTDDVMADLTRLVGDVRSRYPARWS